MATVGVNSYISVEDFKLWAADFGYELYEWLDGDISAASVRSAVNFIDPNYDFKGTKSVDTQPMKLPTNEVAIADIKNAAAQAVWQDLNGFLFVDMKEQSSKGKVVKESKELAGMKKSVEYSDEAAKVGEYDTSVIDKLIRPYLSNSSAFSSLRVL